MILRTPADLYPYQRDMARAICEHVTQGLPLAVWARVGAGKTAATATAIATLQAWERHTPGAGIKAALVFGTRRIAQSVWLAEVQAWSHLRNLRVAVLRGPNREYLLRTPSDIYVINYESIPWLITQLHHHFFSRSAPLLFDMVVFDELTKLKHATGKRFRYLFEGLLPAINKRVGLTGTPAPNGYADLHGQVQALDNGRRLGTEIGHYKDRFFDRVGWGGKKLVLKKGAKEEIHKLIADVVIQVVVPRRTAEPVINDLWVEMPPEAEKEYEELEKEFFVELETGHRVRAVNVSARDSKLLQYAGGAVIHDTEAKAWTAVHDAKLEALDDLLEDLGGRPLLVAYQFRADMRRIRERYEKKYKVAYIGPGVGDREGKEIEDRWNAGEYNLLLGHPQSIGHGLNFQYGGHEICFFGETWNLELHDQFIGRLDDRHGQAEQVIIHRILTRRTMDEVVRTALMNKIEDQEGLRQAMLEYRRKKMETQA